MSEIQTQVENRVGRLTLNRPRAINALSSAIIDQMTAVLRQWADDDGIDEVEVSGAGRGFCAGADVREMRQMILEDTGDPVQFLAREYALDRLVATYPKPYTARTHGIVMGGGMGISIHGSRRIVTSDTVLAMPETTIGLWPDVGMMYHLSRLPGEVGTYMGLTGESITGAEAVHVGLADALSDDTGDGADATNLPDHSWMASHFAGDDIGAIMDRLEHSETPQARQAGETIRMRCPMSVAVTLEALRRAEAMTLDEVFAQDLCLGRFFCRWPDFVEGVRAQLVDKDHCPRWVHPRVEDVSPAVVHSVFASEAWNH